MLQTSPIPSNSEALNMITMEFDSDSYIHETWHTSKEKSLIQLDSKHRSININNAMFDWTRTAMSQSLLLIPFWVLRPTLLSPGELRHYFLKKISADIGASLLFHEVFRIFDTSKSYCKQISIWSWHPTCLHLLVKIILDYKPQTSTSCSLKKFLDLSKKLILKFEFLKNLDTFVCITQP